jgi:hypothetical protein
MNNKTTLKKLQKQQNRAMRAILRSPRRTRIDAILQTLKWMSISQRINFNMLVFIFRIKNGMVPDYIKDMVKTVSSRTNRVLRNADDFHVPMRNTTLAECSIFHNGLKMFNNLPRILKNEINLEKFKGNLKSFVLQYVDV